MSGATTLGTTTADAAGNYSYTITAANITTIAQGSDSITATQTDAAGNTGTSAAFAINVDTLAPSAPVFALGSNVSGGATSAEAIQGTGVVTVNAELGSAISVTFTNGAATVTKSLTGTGAAQAVTLVAADVTALGQGTINVAASATDVAGNTSALGNSSFTLDTVAPSVTISAIGGPDSVVSSVAGDAVVTGTAEALRTVTIMSGATTLGTTTADAAGNYSYTITAANITTIAQGGDSITATQTDAAGNTGTSAAFAINVDTVAPTATVAITSIVQDTGASTTDFITSDAGITMNGTTSVALGAGEKVQVSSNGINWFDATQPTTTTWSYTEPSSKADGQYSYQVRIVDQAGNVGSSTDSQLVVIDTTSPSIPVITYGRTSLNSQGNNNDSTTVTITFSEKI
jgi:uncharacterized protein YegP (UPF0339 family)